MKTNVRHTLHLLIGPRATTMYVAVLQLAQGSRIFKTIATCFFLSPTSVLRKKVTQYVIGYNELPFSFLSLATFFLPSFLQSLPFMTF